MLYASPIQVGQKADKKYMPQSVCNCSQFTLDGICKTLENH